MRRKRSLGALFLIGLMAMGLSACGSDDDDESTATTEAEASGPNVVTVKEQEYGYTMSGSAREGWLTLDIENVGKEFHMIALGKFKPGKTTADIVKAFQQEGGGDESEETTTSALTSSKAGTSTTTAGEEEKDPFEEIFEGDELGAPGGLTQPGAHQKVTTNKLTAGKYALMCFIPAEGDGAPHAAKGMVASLEVKDAKTPAPEPSGASTPFVINKDKPGTGPATLPAGETTFKVTGDGTHEFTVAQLKPGKTPSDADKYFDSVFDSDKPPAKGTTVANAPTTYVANTFEFNKGDTVYVTLTLKPGTYYIGCTYGENDDDDDPSNDVFHGAKEMIKVTVT